MVDGLRRKSTIVARSGEGPNDWLIPMQPSPIAETVQPVAAQCPPFHDGYSHSMVPGGLLVTSSVTRLISLTSLVMRVEMRSRTS